MRFRGYMLLLSALVFSGALFSQAQKDREEPKKPVDIKADLARRSPDLDENAIILTGNVVFHHNGAVITCDSAIRYSDRHIDCFRNVIINKDSTFIYGDRAEYDGERNLARVYSPIIKIIDGDATLYTYNFTFNTRDNIGIFYGGGVIYQQDNVLESEKGYYFSDLREIVAIRDVEMKNDDYMMISDSVRYNMDTRMAHFYTPSHIWTVEGEILAADAGRYNTADSTFFFTGNSYVLTDIREAWADTMDYNAKREDAVFRGNIQLNDEDNMSSAFGDYGQYWGERGETMMTRMPSLMNFNEERNNRDTMYMRADTIFMQVTYPSDRPKRIREGAAEDPHAHLRFADTMSAGARIAMADSLRMEIIALKLESTLLQHRADSIMDALYPERRTEMEQHRIPMPEFEGPEDVGSETPDETEAAEAVETVEAAEETEVVEPAVVQDESAGEAPRRGRRNRGGPSPSYSWIYDRVEPDSAALNSVVRDSLGVVLPLPPTDSLSSMERVRELLPDELSGREASSLLETLENDPEALSEFISDSIDAAALRSVLEAGVRQETVTAPPEVEALRQKLEELNARIDSLQTAEKYIRPKAESILPGELPEIGADSAADTLETAAGQIDTLPPLTGKELKNRLKAEEKAAKLQARIEKNEARDSAHTAKEDARLRKEIDKWYQRIMDQMPPLEPPVAGPSDLLARLRLADSVRIDAEHRLADSLAGLDKKALREYKKALKKRTKAEKKAEKAAERRRQLVDRWRVRLAELVPPGTAWEVSVGDSLPAVLDSLETLPESETAEKDSVERTFYGYYNVKVWRKDMQAVCDSIIGFSVDSTIHMHIDPILWHGASQIVSDSLTIHTLGENIDFVEFFGNPIMSSKVGEGQFNQVTGRTMTSFFRDNEVFRHDVHGNAEAFYYIQEDDDPTPVAFIVATSSNMTFLIEDQFIRYIIARENVEWPVYPLDQIPASQPVELKSFKWFEHLRPDLKDVFDRVIRPTERSYHESLEQPKFPIAARINRRREYLIENRMWADRVDPLPAHAVEFVASLQNR